MHSPNRGHAARGALFIALSAVGYGVMPILIKIAYEEGAKTFGLLALRFASAFLALFVIAAIRGKLGDLKVAPRTFSKLALLGGVFFAGTSITLYLSVGLLDPSVAELIYFSYPAFVLLIAALFLKERVGARKLAGLVLMLAGVAFTVIGPRLFGTAQAAGGGGSGPRAIGTLLALLCAFVYSLYVTFIQDRDVKAAGPRAISLYVTAACAVVFSIAFAVSGEGLPSFGIRGLAALASIVIFSTILPIFLFASGSRILPASEVALIACLEPAITVIADFLFLGRRFDGPTAVGLALIGGGLVAINLFRE